MKLDFSIWCHHAILLLMPQKDLKTVQGHLKSKDHVTLMVCANATGMHKLQSTLIGKNANLACFHKRKWPVTYMNHQNTWVDKRICRKWFNEDFFHRFESTLKDRSYFFLTINQVILNCHLSIIFTTKLHKLEAANRSRHHRSPEEIVERSLFERCYMVSELDKDEEKTQCDTGKL